MSIEITTINPWSDRDDEVARWHFTDEDAKAVLQEWIDPATVSVRTFEGRGAEGDLLAIDNGYVVINEGDQRNILELRTVSHVWIETDEELPTDVLAWIKATIAFNETDEDADDLFSVWVGGGEVNDSYLSKVEAFALAEKWAADGYKDVQVRNETTFSIS
jgi:hypothetical protein